MNHEASLEAEQAAGSRRGPMARWLAEDVGVDPVRANEWLAVVLLTVVALALRVFRLADLPPGLHIDEAFNILDARSVIDGWRPVFLPANAGRDVLYTYLQAPLLARFGESTGTARLASALVGTLTVPVAWGFVRSLPVPRAPRVALLTAGFTALSYWHLHFSRFGIRAVTFPLVVTLVLWAWWRCVAPLTHRSDSRPPLPAVLLCGALLGLAAYAHPAGRFLLVIPAVHAGYLFLRHRDIRPVKYIAVAVLLAALVALPLARYWAQNPAAFTGHAQEVSVLDGGLSAVGSNVAKVAGMFNVAGDPAGWRNLITGQPASTVAEYLGASEPTRTLLRGRPVFDVVVGLLFLIGLVMMVAAVLRNRDWAALIIIWIGVLLVPTLVTDAAPNFSRAIGVIPAVFMLPAVALDLAADRLSLRWGRTLGSAVVVAVLLFTGLATVRDYFVVWAQDANTPIAFDSEKVALARYVDSAASEGKSVFVSPSIARHPTVQVSADSDLRGFDPEHGLVAGSSGTDATEYVFGSDDPAWAALEEQLGDALSVEPIGSRLDYRHAVEDVAGLNAVDELADRFRVGTVSFGDDLPQRPSALRLKLAEPMIESAEAFEFGDSVRLVSAHVDPLWLFVEQRPDGSGTEPLTTTVTLVWHVVDELDADLSAMVHLVALDGETWGVGDGGPLGGTYPTTGWRAGELVFDTHTIVSDPAPPAGDVEIVVGLYDWQTGERLPVHGPKAGLRQDGTAASAVTTTVIYD